MSAAMSGDRNFHMIEAVSDRLEGAPLTPRRRWSDDIKARAVAESLVPGANVSAIARRVGIVPSQLFGWRRQAIRNGLVTLDNAQAGSARVKADTVSSSVVEIVVGDVTIRAGADIDEAHLRRMLRAVRSS